MPEYPRRIKVSDSRRPIYYIWDGQTVISERGKKLPSNKYIEDKRAVTNAYGKIKPRYLKPQYGVGVYKGINRIGELLYSNDKLVEWYYDTSYPKSLISKPTKYILFNKATGVQELANPKVAGTPRWYTIRGQDFYSGNIDSFTRVLVMEAI